MVLNPPNTSTSPLKVEVECVIQSNNTFCISFDVSQEKEHDVRSLKWVKYFSKLMEYFFARY